MGSSTNGPHTHVALVLMHTQTAGNSYCCVPDEQEFSDIIALSHVNSMLDTTLGRFESLG